MLSVHPNVYLATVSIVNRLELEPLVLDVAHELLIVVVPQISVVGVDHSSCGVLLTAEDLHDRGA